MNAKRILQETLRRAGYEIHRTDSLPTMAGALQRLGPRHSAHTVVDVGASNGRWSELAKHAYPDAAFLLIEAQKGPYEPALRRLSERRKDFHYVLAAAGDRSGTIHFDASDASAGAASEEPFLANDIVVPMTTVDAEVARLGLPPPYLMKLDTHGFEVAILDGAAATLKQSSLLVVEAYNFELRRGVLRFHELCGYLGRKGFRAIDLVDVMRRPRDSVLWQFDLFFAPDDRPEFASDSYE